MNEFDATHDLLSDYEIAELVDEKVSTIRRWVEEEPERLPRPLRFGTMLRWPAMMVQAWVKAGGPPDFEHGPQEFCPEWLSALAEHQSANVEFKDDTRRKYHLAGLLTYPRNEADTF